MQPWLLQILPELKAAAQSSQAGHICCAGAQSCHSDVCVILPHCPVPVGLWAASFAAGLPALLLDFCSFCLQEVFGYPCLLMIFDGFLRCSLYSTVPTSQISVTHCEFCVFFIITKLMAEVSLGQVAGAWGSECVRWECGQVWGTAQLPPWKGCSHSLGVQLSWAFSPLWRQTLWPIAGCLLLAVHWMSQWGAELTVSSCWFFL